MQLTVSIHDPRVEQIIQEKLRSGEYRSVDDVVAAGIAMLAQDPDALLPEDELASLRNEINQGLKQADSGLTARWDADGIRQAVRNRLSQS